MIYRLKKRLPPESPRSNVVVELDGVTHVLEHHKDYDGDDPVVIRFGSLFEAPNIEAATAAPGERRSTRRSKPAA